MTDVSQISMFRATKPAMVQVLKTLKNIVTKSQEFCTAKKIDEAVFLNARLSLDMFTFMRQAQVVTDNAKGAMARLGLVENPKFEDTEKTFVELLARIDLVSAFVEGVDKAGFENSETRDIVLKFGPQEFPFVGIDYLTGFALPNTYFHLSMAYAIARHNGVELSKSDFLRG